MTDENLTLCEELLNKRLEFAKNAESGSKEEQEAISDVVSLWTKANEHYKLDASWDETQNKLEFEKEKLEKELELEREKHKEDLELEREKAELENTRRLEESKKNMWITLGTTAVGSIGSIFLQQFFVRKNMKDSIEFEKSDSMSSSAGRSFFRDAFKFLRK